MEDSTYELVSNSSVISEDEARTVSVSSQSIDGDTEDDFSEVDPDEDIDSGAEEEDEHMTASDAIEGEGEQQSEVETPSINHQSAFRARQIDDSDMTARPEEGPRRRATRVTTSESPSITAVESDVRSTAVLPPAREDRDHHKKNLMTLVADAWIAFRKTPFAANLAVLPWTWIGLSTLALIQVAFITSISGWLNQPQPPVPQPLTHLREAFRPEGTPIMSRVDTPSFFDFTSLTHLFGQQLDPAQVNGSVENDHPRSTKKGHQPLKKTKINVESKISPSGKKALHGPDLDYEMRKPGAFRLIQQDSEYDYLLVAPASIVFGDPRITVSASRHDVPVKFSITKLRRGVHHIHFAKENARGKVDVVIRLLNKPNKVYREQVNFRPAWLIMPQGLPAPAADLRDAASETAFKVVEMIRTDVLAPAESATKQMAIYVRQSLSLSQQQDSRRRRENKKAAAKINNGLIAFPQLSWDVVSEQHRKIQEAGAEVTKALSRGSFDILHRVGRNARAVHREISKSSSAAYQAMKKQVQQADLSRPIGVSKQKLGKAQLNAKGLAEKVKGGLKKNEKKKKHGVRRPKMGPAKMKKKASFRNKWRVRS